MQILTTSALCTVSDCSAYEFGITYKESGKYVKVKLSDPPTYTVEGCDTANDAVMTNVPTEDYKVSRTLKFVKIFVSSAPPQSYHLIFIYLTTPRCGPSPWTGTLALFPVSK